MLNTVSRFVIAVFLIGICTSPSLSQERNIQKRIVEAMEASRRGDNTLFYKLRASPDLVTGFQFLELYVDDEDAEVRGGVVSLICDIDDPRVVPLLVKLIGTEEHPSGASVAAVLCLVTRFGRREVSENRTDSLRNALMRKVAGPSGFNADYLLLLSCFRSDEVVLRFLRELRAAPGAERGRAIQGRLVIPARAAIDLALAEVGDRDALARTREHVACEDDDVVLFLLQSLRFVSDPLLLGDLVQLTRMKRVGQTIPDGDPLRICDVAVSCFVEALGTDVVRVPKRQRYSDLELSTAYGALSSWLANRDAVKADRK